MGLGPDAQNQATRRASDCGAAERAKKFAPLHVNPRRPIP